MSVHKIPNKYLNTTLYFFRESFSFDDVGDLKKDAQSLAYSSISGNVQASAGTQMEYDLNGRTYVQDHVAYINRTEDSVERDILPGDIMYDQETEIKYLVLGTEVWQAVRKSIHDSHHVKVIVKAMSGLPKDDPVVMISATVKASITAVSPLGINVNDSSPVIDVMGG